MTAGADQGKLRLLNEIRNKGLEEAYSREPNHFTELCTASIKNKTVNKRQIHCYVSL